MTSEVGTLESSGGSSPFSRIWGTRVSLFPRAIRPFGRITSCLEPRNTAVEGCPFSRIAPKRPRPPVWSTISAPFVHDEPPTSSTISARFVSFRATNPLHRKFFSYPEYELKEKLNFYAVDSSGSSPTRKLKPIPGLSLPKEGVSIGRPLPLHHPGLKRHSGMNWRLPWPTHRPMVVERIL